MLNVLNTEQKEKKMNIKVNPSHLTTKITYPCILQSKYYPEFIIFCSEKERNAIVLSSSDESVYSIGEYYGKFNESNYYMVSGDMVISY